MGKTSNKRILSVTIQRIEDTDPDTSYLEQDGFEDRLEDFNNDEFAFMGVRAKAEIQIDKGSVIQTITSGGLWSIESDSSEDYLRIIEQEELSQLREELRALGFSARAVSEAFSFVGRN